VGGIGVAEGVGVRGIGLEVAVGRTGIAVFVGTNVGTALDAGTFCWLTGLHPDIRIIARNITRNGFTDLNFPLIYFCTLFDLHRFLINLSDILAF
jgi:hypothetical protein